MIKQDIIEKWELYLRHVVNPDNFIFWSDLGFDEAPEGYTSIEEYMLNDPEQERDETEIAEIRMVYAFLDDLKNLNTWNRQVFLRLFVTHHLK